MLSTSKCFGLLLGCGMSLLAQRAFAQFVYIDTPTIINYPIDSGVRIGFNNPDPFTVEMVEGGSVSRNLSTWHKSYFLMSGGSIGGAFTALDDSTIEMIGGQFGSRSASRGNAHLIFAGGVGVQLFGFENGTITMRGGRLTSAAFATQTSTFNYYAGEIVKAALQIYDTSTTNIYGAIPYIYALGPSDFSLPETKANLNIYGSNLSVEGEGIEFFVRGNDVNGQPYNIYLAKLNGAFGTGDFQLNLINIAQVPEPSTLGALAVGAMCGCFLLRYRKQ
jgi:hypothetical protein